MATAAATDATITNDNAESDTLMVVYNGVSANIHTLFLTDAPQCFFDRIKDLAAVEKGAPMPTFGPFDRSDKSVGGLIDVATDADGANHAAIWAYFDAAKPMEFAHTFDFLAGISIAEGSAPETAWPRSSDSRKASAIPQRALALTDVVRAIERGDVEALNGALHKVDEKLLNSNGERRKYTSEDGNVVTEAFFGASADDCDGEGDFPNSLLSCLVFVLQKSMDIHIEIREAGDDPQLVHLTRPRRVEMLLALIKHQKTDVNACTTYEDYSEDLVDFRRRNAGDKEAWVHDDCMAPIDYAFHVANHRNGEGNKTADSFRSKVIGALLNSGKLDVERPLHLWYGNNMDKSQTMAEMAWALKDKWLVESVLGARLSIEGLTKFKEFLEGAKAKVDRNAHQSGFTSDCLRLTEVRLHKKAKP